MKGVLLLLSLSFLGCSGSDGPGAATAGAGGSGGSAGKASGGEGTSGGSAMGGSAGSGGQAGKAGSASGGQGGADTSGAWETIPISLPLRLRGDLNAIQLAPDPALSANGPSYLLFAKFGMLRGQWDGCVRHQLGHCWYYECPTGSLPIGVEQRGGQSIGQSLVVTGPQITRTLYFQDTDYSDSGTGAIWTSGGGILSFSAASGSFTFKMDVATPPLAKLLTINGQPFNGTIQRSAGAKLTWKSSGEGAVFFSLHRDNSPTPPAAICTFDATLGEGLLPASVLTQLAAGTDYKLTFRGDERGRVIEGDYELEATVMTMVSESAAPVPVTLQ